MMVPGQTVRCYIGLGTNMGDTKANLNHALELLKTNAEITVQSVAPFYITEPVGYTQQDYFLNTVAEIATTLGPLPLLDVLQHIENRMGRVRTIHWGPRTLDLDLLLYGQEVIDLPGLQVPHPRMHERAFVMVPLADLNPGLVVAGAQAAELARRLAAEQQINPV